MPSVYYIGGFGEFGKLGKSRSWFIVTAFLSKVGDEREKQVLEVSGTITYILSCVCSWSMVGSYSDSVGIEVIRRHVADYIERRDGGIASDYSDVFLSNGASCAIKVRSLKSTSNGYRTRG